LKIRDLVVEADGLADQLDGKFAATALDGNQSEQVEAVEMMRDARQDLADSRPAQARPAGEA